MTKRTKDPYAEREARKYDNPIASREFILSLLEQTGVPMRREEIAQALNIHDEAQQTALHRRLRAMERDGQILFNRRRQYCLASKIDLITGRVIAHPNGFGFLVPDKGGDDLFLPSSEMRVLMHGDRAVVREIGQDRRGRREAVVVEILERGVQHVVGRLFIEAGVGFVIADNKRITHDVLIPREDFHGARHGQIVTVEIMEFPTRNRQAIGRVIEILGDHMAPGMEIDIAIRNYDLPQQWSDAVEVEIRSYNEIVREQDKRGREDLTQLPLVTIDGEDARDFDDAVFCERKGKGYRLIVAIADVSHYVKPGTALDAEARHRGNSVYFPERVIPMLPEILSNGLCSLNPLVDRLCMACEMDISASGALKKYRFIPAVMHSHARLTYNKVAAMLVEQDASLREQYHELVPHLETLYALFKVLLAARNKRGAIDFDSTETRIVFGENRKIERIIPVVRNDAHRLIEECMLMANVAAADYLLSHKIASLYRNHEPPGQEKLTDLREFLGELGLTLGGGDEPEPKHSAKFLEQVKGRRDAHLIQTVLLRSLRQAMYGADNLGHFGLAFEAYAHFTSPIRRYPDLLVHRAIRHVLSKQKASEFTYSQTDMENLGDHCSMTERRADEATRDAVDWLKCEYMLDKLGSEFDGIITSVTNFGIFVELSEIYVEGLVHVTALRQDYYHYDPVHHRMIGERSNKIYRLGDPVKVVVARVDLDERKIDFELTDKQPADSRTPPASKRRKGKAKQTQSRPDHKTRDKNKRKTDSRSRKAKQHGGKKKTTTSGRNKKSRR
jgi:ribonuclease R